MEEKDWVILQTVYEEKNITKAAHRLFMAQTTLTYRLQQIEKEFDTLLFYRGRRGVEFTAQGELLVKYAQEMLQKLRETKDTLLNLEGKVAGTLKLAVTKSFALYRLPALLRAFRQQYPNVDFTVTTGSNLELTQSLHRHEAHVAIVRGIQHWPDEKKVIANETICVLAKENIVLQDLPSMPRIDYEPKPSLNIVIDNWWRENFATPPFISMTVDNVEMAKRMVKNDLGYTIAPSSVFDENDGLYKWNLTTPEQEPILWQTWILYRRELMKLPAVRGFITFMRDHSLEKI